MAGYTPRQFTCPQAVTHPSSNRAQCHLSVEANALTTTLRCHNLWCLECWLWYIVHWC